MGITQTYAYLRPPTMGELLEILGGTENGGGKETPVAILAGGTDLIVRIKEDIQRVGMVVDIKGIPELKRLEFGSGATDGGTLTIGATTTFTEILENTRVRSEFPLLWECSRTVASNGIRNRATLIGNICSAVPSLDSAPALFCHDAIVSVVSKGGKRDIPIAEWFTGPKKTALKPGELVESVTLLRPVGKSAGCYVKLGRYNGEDLAQAGVGILSYETEGKMEWRVALCALGPTPVRALKTEGVLNRSDSAGSLTDARIAEAKKTVVTEISPISDIRSSREYRILMTGIMLERGLKTCAERLAGGGPVLGANLIGG